MGFIEELKRRNVFRIGIGYSIVAWLLLQVADVVLDNTNAPDWVMQVFMLALLIGLPIALVFAWSFELTPEGLKLDSEVDHTQSIARNTGRKLDFAVIGVLVLALSYLIYEKFITAPEPGLLSESAEVVKGQDSAQQSAPQTIDRKSIAVLPFTNRSDLKEDEYFSDGIHDDLVTNLSKIGSLKVISRTSAMRFRGSDLSIPEIAQQLGVATVLEGGIQRSGDQVRINAQLVDASTDKNLWAENYDRELTAETLFSIQSEISREIVAALQATMSEREKESLDTIPTSSLEAYGEFVLGRQEVTMRTVDSLESARTHFENAIEFDPNYSLAYVGLADSLDLLSTYGDVDRQALMEPRQRAVDTALSLDPNSGEAYTSLAGLRTDQAKDDEAEQYYLKAIELNPNYVTAHHWYSFLLNRRGRFEEALMQVQKAIELNPMAPILTSQYARVLWNLGRVEAANAALMEGVRRNPRFPNHYTTMAANLRELGLLGESMQWLIANRKLDSTQAFGLIVLCKRYLDFDYEQEAANCFDEADATYPEASVGSRVELWQFRFRFPEALEEARRLAQRFPNPFAEISLGWNHINNRQFEETLAIARKNRPHYFDGSEISLQSQDDLNYAAMSGYALYSTGKTEPGNALLDQALAYMNTIHRVRGEGYSELDVTIHVLRGEKTAAITALRDAIDSGWRDNWWRLRYPFYEVMLDEPEWVAMVKELQTDVRGQRQWYEEHKDDPLF